MSSGSGTPGQPPGSPAEVVARFVGHLQKEGAMDALRALIAQDVGNGEAQAIVDGKAVGFDSSKGSLLELLVALVNDPSSLEADDRNTATSALDLLTSYAEGLTGGLQIPPIDIPTPTQIYDCTHLV